MSSLCKKYAAKIFVTTGCELALEIVQCDQVSHTDFGTNVTKGRIFISYRRGTDGNAVSRMFAILENEFGKGYVFIDINSIEYGTDFGTFIDQELQSCSAFIAVIGPSWIERKHELHNTDDFVRKEIAAALAQNNLSVIPVLIDGVQMNDVQNLPEILQDLRNRNGLSLPPQHFELVVRNKLIPSIHSTLRKPAESDSLQIDTGSPGSFRRILIAIVTFAASVVLLYVWLNIDILGLGDSLPIADQSVIESPAILNDNNVWYDCTDCPSLKLIEAGSFTMGYLADSETPRHTYGSEPHIVSVSAFFLGKTEVTFDQWQECVDDGGCIRIVKPDDMGWGRGSRPVINLSWYDIQEYITWLNGKVDGEPYRLPSSAEWEYAAKAGTITPFSFGYQITTDQANFDGTRPFGDSPSGQNRTQTVPVGALEAENQWGLRHMHGNVWEWTQDCWHNNYIGAPTNGSAWLNEDSGNCDRRVIRGGSMGNAAINLQSAERSTVSNLHARQPNLGFRVARALTPNPNIPPSDGS